MLQQSCVSVAHTRLSPVESHQMTESSDMALHADFLLARSGCVIIVVLLLSVCRPSNQQGTTLDA